MHYVHFGVAESARRVFKQIAEAGRYHPAVRLTEETLRGLENREAARRIERNISAIR